MTLIRPFAALRPVTYRAADVIAPPYDVLSSAVVKSIEDLLVLIES